MTTRGAGVVMREEPDQGSLVCLALDQIEAMKGAYRMFSFAYLFFGPALSNLNHVSILSIRRRTGQRQEQPRIPPHCPPDGPAGFYGLSGGCSVIAGLHNIQFSADDEYQTSNKNNVRVRLERVSSFNIFLPPLISPSSFRPTLLHRSIAHIATTAQTLEIASHHILLPTFDSRCLGLEQSDLVVTGPGVR